MKKGRESKEVDISHDNGEGGADVMPEPGGREYEE